eukprot:m51a1_g2663 hypothetical protein (404) ;mRNA; r:652549-680377
MAANWLPMTLKAFRHNQRILHSKVKGMSLLLDSVDFKLKGRTLVYDGHWVKNHKDTLKRRFPDDKIGADCHFEWARDNMSNPSFFVPYPEPKKRRNSDEIPELLKKKKLYNEAQYRQATMPAARQDYEDTVVQASIVAISTLTRNRVIPTMDEAVQARTDCLEVMYFTTPFWDLMENTMQNATTSLTADQIIKGLEAARAKLKDKITTYKKEQIRVTNELHEQHVLVAMLKSQNEGLKKQLELLKSERANWREYESLKGTIEVTSSGSFLEQFNVTVHGCIGIALGREIVANISILASQQAGFKVGLKLVDLACDRGDYSVLMVQLDSSDTGVIEKISKSGDLDKLTKVVPGTFHWIKKMGSGDSSSGLISASTAPVTPAASESSMPTIQAVWLVSVTAAFSL